LQEFKQRNWTNSSTKLFKKKTAKDTKERYKHVCLRFVLCQLLQLFVSGGAQNAVVGESVSLRDFIRGPNAATKLDK